MLLKDGEICIAILTHELQFPLWRSRGGEEKDGTSSAAPIYDENAPQIVRREMPPGSSGDEDEERERLPMTQLAPWHFPPTVDVPLLVHSAIAPAARVHRIGIA
jgi:hypothetical protein